MYNEGKDSDGLLSVVIPYYNGYDFVFQMVADLLRIRQLKEIIIVDDGSPDNRTNDLKEAFREEKKVSVYRKENGGIADARNFGLGLASGQYVLFVDQDDKIVPETVDETLEMIIVQQSDCALWSTKKISDNGIIKPLCSVKSDCTVGRNVIRNEFIKTLLFFKPNEWITCAGQAWGGIFKTSFLKENGIEFIRFVNYEDDLIFTLLLLLNSDNISLNNRIGYYWNVRDASYSHTLHYISDLAEKYERLYSYICAKLRKYEITEEITQKYELLSMQQIPVRDIYNRCINHETTMSIRHTTKALMKEGRDKYKYHCSCAQNNRYYKVAYYLLRYRIYLGAVLLCKYIYNKNVRMKKTQFGVMKNGNN